MIGKEHGTEVRVNTVLHKGRKILSMCQGSERSLCGG